MGSTESLERGAEPDFEPVSKSILTSVFGSALAATVADG